MGTGAQRQAVAAAARGQTGGFVLQGRCCRVTGATGWRRHRRMASIGETDRCVTMMTVSRSLPHTPGRCSGRLLARRARRSWSGRSRRSRQRRPLCAAPQRVGCQRPRRRASLAGRVITVGWGPWVRPRVRSARGIVPALRRGYGGGHVRGYAARFLAPVLETIQVGSGREATARVDNQHQRTGSTGLRSR